MSITGIRYNENTKYPEKAASHVTDSHTSFQLEEPKPTETKVETQSGCVPEQFAGMSFQDLISSGKGNPNPIPVVNQIVSSKNQEDGKIYVTFFTDKKITCNRADGELAWELAIEDEQQTAQISQFFQEHQTVRNLAKEYYSGANMGMVSSKKFWLDLFQK